MTREPIADYERPSRPNPFEWPQPERRPSWWRRLLWWRQIDGSETP